VYTHYILFITCVDVYSAVGNEGSAFVELLVGRSSSADDYKVLLVASTFMSPPDSKAWNNTNRVRMFGPEKLSKAVAEQKWDRVKVMCTQPYNKKEQYGLSFITLHSPPGDSSSQQEDKKTTPTKPTLGAFSLKEEPKPLPTGTLFYKKNHAVLSPAGSSSNAAAQARSASAAALQGVDTPSRPSPRNRGLKGQRNEGENGRDKASKRAAEDKNTSSPQKKAEEWCSVLSEWVQEPIPS
jgi:DNA-repair protein XRCC1